MIAELLTIISAILLMITGIIWWVHRRPRITSVFRIHSQACAFCYRHVGHRGDCPTQDRPTGDTL